MTIEPSAVRFTIGTKVVGPKTGSRNVSDYRAALEAKHGRVPSYTEFAARENKAAKREWDRHSPSNAISNKQKVYERRLAWATVLARISPVTSLTAAEAMGLHHKHVSCRMDALESAGFAKRISRSPIVWEVKI